MPWNAGIFTRLYNFVNDAANGIKIIASKQDDEWNNVVAGLNSNVITRDGVNAPTADVNWGGKKLTNLATGTAPGDAVNFGQLPAATNPWDQSKVVSASYVSPTQLRILGADYTWDYHVGRRIRMYGAVAAAGTIAAATYTAPDTIVTVVVDNAFGSVVDPSVSTVTVGLLDYYIPEYLSPRTAVQVIGASQFLPGGSGTWRFPFRVELIDVLGEFDGANFHRFTAKYPGVYRFAGACVATASASVASQVSVGLQKNGAEIYWAFIQTMMLYTGNYFSAPFAGLVTLAPNDYVDIMFGVLSSDCTVQPQSSSLAVDRIV